MCSPASFETAYVQRASPTEPIVVTCASCTLNACWPNTSLVEKSTSRSIVSRDRKRGLEHVVRPDDVHPHRAHRAREHRVHAGDPGAVDDVGRPADDLRQALGVEDVALDEREVRMVGEIRAAERVAVEVVDRDDLVLVDEPARERRADEAGAAGDDDLACRSVPRGESSRTAKPRPARLAPSPSAGRETTASRRTRWHDESDADQCWPIARAASRGTSRALRTP